MYNAEVQLWILKQHDCWDATNARYNIYKLYDERARVLGRALTVVEAFTINKEAVHATDLRRVIEGKIKVKFWMEAA